MSNVRLPTPIGKKYGRLLVLGDAPDRKTPSSGRSRRFCDCLCDCGKRVEVSLPDLKNGHTTSCGCAWCEATKKAATSHGKSKTRVYTSWQGMRDRCTNPSNAAYANYGGRGISVCERWESFENFFQDMGDPPPHRSLDRINNDQGYSPHNCRWATRVEQNNNQRDNRLLTFEGKTQTLGQWAKAKGINRTTLASRLKRGLNKTELFKAPTPRLG